ncbi:leucine dehydrogenase [Cetobacterium ceti]|uniref:Leucine dehydrogenase n=1 Tax=Cetobacterium ceti TaxID=180163 RepID=A0A1T4PGG9_9FUSO|nr:Glu/Leu/Phe/Val dehydrogenase dimerization domain-containing protein [Cetobacterium ceti]SJZ90417.1 leucine dehydrogenase [Cetobacterium ceti]
MNIFKKMEEFNYEQLVYFYDSETELKGITCIHNTTLGPALGGTRLWNYNSEEDAVEDVIRLARGMTYKAACAGLNLGGGKTVLIGDAKKIKSESYFRGLGRYVQSLNGRYITAEDVNTSTKDMAYVAMETDYVVGLGGKSGNPSPVTAYGAFMGIKAALMKKFEDSSIEGRTFAVQGAGQTGYYLIDYLLGNNKFKEKAKKIYFTEINESYIERMNKEHPEVEFISPDKIYSLEVDVFVPCALGKIVNDKTIDEFKCPIIAGTANNVLEREAHGNMLKERGILYAPDYVINAGGLINVYHELNGYNKENAILEVELIYDRLLEIFNIADSLNISTNIAANEFAEKRIKQIKSLKNNFIKR